MPSVFLMLMSFAQHGFEIVDHVIDSNQIASIKRELSEHSLDGCIRHADKKLESVQSLLSSGHLQQLASQYLSNAADVVRVILFNKSLQHNWFVAWHQDKTVALSESFDTDGWQFWNMKDGVQHVQPPLEVLEQMVTLRLHLDACDQNSGCLRVIPNSHKDGVLSAQQIQEYSKHSEIAFCKAEAGSALVMRPHILHASSKTQTPSDRHILHIEFSCYRLPRDVQWA